MRAIALYTMLAVVPYMIRTVVYKCSLVESNCTLLYESRCPKTLAHVMRAIALYTMLAVVPNACTLDKSN